MKHKHSIIIILLAMFLLTQFIGLYVINFYTPRTYEQFNSDGEIENITENYLPKFFQVQEDESEKDFWFYLIQIIPAFVIAIFLILILTKYKLKFFIRIWFLLVITIALYLSFFAFSRNLLAYAGLISLVLGLVFAIIKIYRPNVLVHNLTELLIYPGISAIFVSILNHYTIIFLLILISIYDLWAVWHSGIMQKMAKFQINELKVIGGFLIPYISSKERKKLKELKSKKSNKKIKVQLAILGGGDIVFPIITSGVFLRAFGIIPALFVIFGAFVGLTYLFWISEKKKFYPAMPFITIGIFIGIILWKLLTLL